MTTVLAERVAAMGQALRIALDDGHAESMGDGMFVLFQEVDGRAVRFTLSDDDMRKMLSMA